MDWQNLHDGIGSCHAWSVGNNNVVGQRCHHRLFDVPWERHVILECWPRSLSWLWLIAEIVSGWPSPLLPFLIHHVLADRSYCLMTERSLLIIAVLNLFSSDGLPVLQSSLIRAFHICCSWSHNGYDVYRDALFVRVQGFFDAKLRRAYPASTSISGARRSQVPLILMALQSFWQPSVFSAQLQ